METEETTEEELNLFTLKKVHRKSKLFTYELLVDGVPLQMEVDTSYRMQPSSYFQKSHP